MGHQARDGVYVEGLRDGSARSAGPVRSSGGVRTGMPAAGDVRVDLGGLVGGVAGEETALHEGDEDADDEEGADVALDEAGVAALASCFVGEAHGGRLGAEGRGQEEGEPAGREPVQPPVP